MIDESLRILVYSFSRRCLHSEKELGERFEAMNGRGIMEMIKFLIKLESDKHGFISERSEDTIRQLTDMLFEHAGKRLEKGEIVRAAEIISTIIVVIEENMEKVYDEGWTFQYIITDSFEFIDRINQQAHSKDVVNELFVLYTRVFGSRDEDYRMYNEEWEKVLGSFSEKRV